MENQELNNNFTSCLKQILLIKDGVEFEIVPWNYSGSPPLESITFTENINSTNMGGSMFIKDLYNWSEAINSHSFSKLVLTFIEKNPTEDSAFKVNKIDFNIISVSQVTNRPISVQMADSQTYTIIRFDFTTEDILAGVLDQSMFPEGKDFVGFIATDGSAEVPGLVNEIFKKLNIENYEVEPTYNGVWIKSNEVSYPWAKNKGQISLSNLMQYICNFSVPKANPNAVNYFFWRDKEGYKFKSVEKLLSEQVDAEYEKINFSTNNELPNQVRNITQMHEANVLELAKTRVFQTYYEKISPNYDEFYLDFVDTALSFKSEIIDFDYHRDYDLWTKVESHKVIPDSHSTSVFVNNLTPIQSLKVDDNVYGYFYNNRQNTPFAQEWDHIGKTMDSRWNNVSYIPQYDITDLDIKTFYTIHKKIREPLKEKRKQYSYLKNLKRKWEVYRCKVCCLADRLGGIQDQIDISRIRGLENPNQNPDFIALFGSTGIFGDSSIDYRIVAAGSFSDVYNYDSGLTLNRGLTLSYDMNSEPFNQTIGDFYYFNDNFNEYEKYVLDGGLKTYDMHIEKNNQLLTIIDEWLSSVDGYILNATRVLDSLLQTDSCSSCDQITECAGNTDVTYSPNADSINNYSTEQCFRFDFSGKYPIQSVEDSNGNVTNKLSDLLNPWAFDCSLQKYIPRILSHNFNNSCVQNQNFSRVDASKFNYYYGNTEGLNFEPVSSEYYELHQKQIEDILNKKAYCPMCLNPISLEISKKYANKQKVTLQAENKLLTYIRDELTNKFTEKWKLARQNYLNRKAFFVSKQEQKINNNTMGVLSSSLSLSNVKSIKRKSIRGSRYEILARKNGITGGNVGEYLYNIFFDDVPSDTNVTGNHPYYDQTYTDKLENSFLSLPKPKEVHKIEDVRENNDPENTFAWKYGPKKIFNSSKLSAYVELTDGDYIGQSQNLGLSNTILRKLNDYYGVDGYENRFRLTQNNMVGKKPPNIKREEISSYVRVEFITPIGLESIADFPDGFIRNAGYEYFLPYIVSLTSGPNGRQTIKQNVVIIGMDPYGFDVAMKRINDSIPNGEHYWWSNNLPVGEMALWPEVAFETKYTYYVEHIPNEKYFNSVQEIYGLNTSVDNYNSGTPNDNPCLDGANLGNNTLINFSGNGNYGNYAVQPNDNFNGYYNFSRNNPTNNSKYDDELRETANASGFLFNTHKVLKAHRNWWSFHIPDNLMIIPKFVSTFRITPNTGNILGDSLETNTFSYYDGEGAIKFKSYSNINNLYYDRMNKLHEIYKHSDYKTVLKLENTPEVYELLQPIIDEDISFFFSEHQSHGVFSVHKDLEIVNPELKKYFSDITHQWLNGDHITYRQPLVTDEVWKYDLSGYSEYGMNFPPVRHNHGDIFDNNFAAQFVVFAKTSEGLCSKNDLKCINPNGSVYSQGCPENDPYCNCPAQNRKPTETEPSYLELYKLEQELKECSLVEEHLGPDWLGCVWSDPKNTGSCNCPEIGDRFMDYLAYNRTYATFWSTPPKTPLLRNSLYNLLFSQTLQLEIPRNDKIRIGSVVLVEDFDEFTGSKYKRFGGKWLVTQISNIFYAGKDYMSITLNRDSFNKDINKTKIPE